MTHAVLLLLAEVSMHPLRTGMVLVGVALVGLLRWRSTRARSRLLGRALVGIATGSAAVLALFCGHAMARPGAPRRAIVVTEKNKQAAAGRLQISTHWGLLDLTHVEATRGHIEMAREHLLNPELRATPLVLEATCATLTGSRVVSRAYSLLDADTLDEADVDAAARAVALQMAFDVERAQESAPRSTGMALSAWQSEDLPSALYAAIGVHDRHTTDASDALARNGWQLARVESRSYTLPADATDQERDAYQRVRTAHARWSVVDPATFAEPGPR